MAELCVRINEFTDPGCPWAYSAEPFRRRLNWLYEGSIEWIPRMVVLADAASDYAERGYTPDWVADSSRRISREHGMPIDTRVKPRVAGTRDACQAVVAARRNGTEFQTRRLLRALEEALLAFAGCAVVISHDRWFLDRVATHVLAFEGDSQVTWFEGNFEAYEEHRHEQLGAEADRPHRITYKRLTARA